MTPVRGESEIRADERRRIVEALRRNAGDEWSAICNSAGPVAAWIERTFPDTIDCSTCGGTHNHPGGIAYYTECPVCTCPDCKDGKVPREYVAVDRLLSDEAVEAAARSLFPTDHLNSDVQLRRDIQVALAAAVKAAGDNP